MFDLAQIIHSGAVRQHVTGTIKLEDLLVVAAGSIPKSICVWRTHGHQASLPDDYERINAACHWLMQRNVKFRLGARWVTEHYGNDVDCTLDRFVVSIERDDYDLISLFHLIFL